MCHHIKILSSVFHCFQWQLRSFLLLFLYLFPLFLRFSISLVFNSLISTMYFFLVYSTQGSLSLLDLWIWYFPSQLSNFRPFISFPLFLPPSLPLLQSLLPSLGTPITYTLTAWLSCRSLRLFLSFFSMLCFSWDSSVDLSLSLLIFSSPLPSLL